MNSFKANSPGYPKGKFTAGYAGTLFTYFLKTKWIDFVFSEKNGQEADPQSVGEDQRRILLVKPSRVHTLLLVEFHIEIWKPQI